MKSIRGKILFLGGLFILMQLAITMYSTGAVMNSRSCDQDSQVSGTWEGTFETLEFPGTLKLVLKIEEDKWSGTLDIFVEMDSASGVLLDIEVDGNSFKCRFTATGPDVKMEGKVDGDKMTGTLAVYQGTELIDEGIFECTRK